MASAVAALAAGKAAVPAGLAKPTLGGSRYSLAPGPFKCLPALCGSLMNSSVLNGTLRYSSVLYGALRYSKVLYGALMYSKVLYGALMYSVRSAHGAQHDAPIRLSSARLRYC